MRYHHSVPSIIAAAAVLSGIWFLAWHEAPARAAHAATEPGAHPAHQVNIAPVQSRSLTVGSNELLVLDVQSPSPVVPLVESQRCYVWRDAEFKTATLACQPGDGAGLPLAPPPPSFER